MIHRKITVNDSLQTNYVYYLTEPIGKTFDLDFKPELTPKKMLELGVFGGNYLKESIKEFPKEWFKNAKLSNNGHNKLINYFKVDASQPLSVWQKKKWIYRSDPRGWFQWYCRYYMGRRIPIEDERQIKRWKGIKRHILQLKKNCLKGDLNCRPV